MIFWKPDAGFWKHLKQKNTSLSRYIWIRVVYRSFNPIRSEVIRIIPPSYCDRDEHFKVFILLIFSHPMKRGFVWSSKVYRLQWRSANSLVFSIWIDEMLTTLIDIKTIEWSNDRSQGILLHLHLNDMFFERVFPLLFSENMHIKPRWYTFWFVSVYSNRNICRKKSSCNATRRTETELKSIPQLRPNRHAICVLSYSWNSSLLKHISTTLFNSYNWTTNNL